MPPAVEGLSIELGTVNETLESRWGKRQLFTHSQTDGVLFLSVSPVLNGRCSMLSPTIILPLIQCLALLHWLPIGSYFGGMHWLHLPAARIPAFLNKALNPPCCWPGCPAPPLLFRCLDAKLKIWCGNNITQNISTWQTTYRGNDGTALSLNSAERDHRKPVGDRDGWSHVAEILLSPASEVISSGKEIDMKRECYQNQTLQIWTERKCQYFSLRGDRVCCVAIHN